MVNRFVLPRLPRATLGALVTMAVLTVGAQNAHAQSNWNGGTGDWNVSTNWTPTGVPNSPTTDVSITGTSSIPSSVALDNLSPTVHNLSLDSFSTLSISAQNLYVAGPSLSNAGQINVGSASLVATIVVDASTVTLSGGGTVNLNNASSEFNSASGAYTLVNQNNTIQGQGNILNLSNFTNQATVNANVPGGTLTIFGPTTTNTGTLEATGGGILNIAGSTVTNTGATISTDSTSTVYINNSTIIGGNLTSASGAEIHSVGNSALNGVTITSGSTYSVDAGTNNSLTGDLTNKGTVLVGGSGGNGNILVEASTVNLSGGGTVILNNANSEINGSSNTLVNKDNTIQGQGTILNLSNFTNQATVNANVSGGTLNIFGPTTTNTGTLEATGGGILSIFGSTVTNTNGTISTDGSSTVYINSSTIIGGNLTSASGAEIHSVGNSALNGVTITSGSTYSVDAGTNNSLTGDLTNKGTVLVGGSGGNGNILVEASTVNLTGGGTVILNNANSEINGSNNTLVNKDNTIQGQGTILNLASFQNQGTVNANVSGGTLSISNVQTTNSGTFQASSGSTLLVNGMLTNYNPSTSTLTGGTFNAYSGTILLSQADATAITPAVITTNAATILLDGASANILDGSGNHILAGFFTTNAAAGNFTIQNGKNLTSSSSDFSNAGTLTVGANSTFTVGGSHNFNNSGLLEGIGTVQASLLSNSGTVHPGDGPGILTVTGNYAQTSTGALGIQIGGSSAGTGFSQLNISGSASLAGTLDLSLINGFTPYNGEQFVILTSTGLSGSFSDNTIPDGNVTFTVAYSPPGYANDVVLDAQVSSSVVPEPASWLMLGLGLTAVGTCVVRKTRSQVRGK